MVRRIISIEGKPDGHGLHIKNGALKLEEETYPILWMSHFDKIVGEARDIQREPSGFITADVTLIDEYVCLMGDVSFSVFANQVVETKPGNDRLVHYALVRYVSVVPHQIWSVDEKVTIDA